MDTHSAAAIKTMTGSKTWVERLFSVLGAKSLGTQLITAYGLLFILGLALISLSQFTVEHHISTNFTLTGHPETKQSLIGELEHLQAGNQTTDQTLRNIVQLEKNFKQKHNSAISSNGTVIITMLLCLLLLLIAVRSLFQIALLRQTTRFGSHLSRLQCHDFSTPIDVNNRENEIGKIFSVYNEVVESVGDMIRHVKHMGSRIETDTEQVISTLNDTDREVRLQEERISFVATATEEMATSITDVAANCASAADASEQADNAAHQGNAVIAHTVSRIQQVSENVGRSGEVVAELARDSQEVSQILEVINDIADQTNLLALNAAIEAARAGEQGRGFSVVADEVRILAQRTQNSTREIREIIERLQHRSQSAVKSITASNQLAKETADEAIGAQEALTEIVKAVTIISEMNIQIASATEEQSQVAHEMKDSLHTISEISHRSSHFSKQTLTSVNHIAEHTQALLSRFERYNSEEKGMDLSQAKSAHLNWKKRLRKFLDGKERLTKQDVLSHEECAFGQWYYSEGRQKYSFIPEMADIESVHRRLHKTVVDAVELKNEGNSPAAEQLYLEVSNISCDIIEMMNIIENRSEPHQA